MYSKSKTFLHLIAPSATGIIVYAAVALTITFIQLVVASTQLHAIQEIGQGTLPIVGSWFVNLVGLARVNSLVIYIFWIAIGMIVWILLKYAAGNVHELADDLSFRKYIWPHQTERNQPLYHFIETNLFRIAIFVLLGFYARYVIARLFYILNDGSALSAWLNAHALITVCFLFISWIIVWHGLVILIRLILLRNRIFTAS